MDESVQKRIEESLPKIGKYQWAADAILRGCALSGPLKYALCDGQGNACAWGALLIGTGALSPRQKATAFTDGMRDKNHGEASLGAAYACRYDKGIAEDNDYNGLTREQIAARIAAL